MPPDPEKRKLRELKRALKKRGNKHRRQQLKRDLAENPEEAAHAEEDLGRHRSENLNGIDRDSTRRKQEEDEPQRHRDTEKTEED
jgi:hypothetical protein